MRRKRELNREWDSKLLIKAVFLLAFSVCLLNGFWIAVLIFGFIGILKISNYIGPVGSYEREISFKSIASNVMRNIF